MQVTASQFFCGPKFTPILNGCVTVTQHEHYEHSLITQEKVGVIKQLFSWDEKQKVVLDVFMKTLSDAFNAVSKQSADRGFLEHKEEAVEKFFVEQLGPPIREFKTWCDQEIKDLHHVHGAIFISLELGFLDPLIEKVKKILDQYPASLSKTIIDILEEEELEENRRIQPACESLENQTITLNNRIAKLQLKQLEEMKSKKSEKNQKKESSKLHTRIKKISAYQINLLEVQGKLVQKYTEFMQKRDLPTPRPFIGKEGYFKDASYAFIPHRWLRELLSYAKLADWIKIAQHAKKESTYYQNRVQLKKSNNHLIKEIGQDILNYLFSLSNDKIDQADATGSKMQNQENGVITIDETIGGNRSLISKFADEGLAAMKRAEKSDWKIFGDKNNIKGLYYIYCLLASLQMAKAARSKILEETGEEGTDKDWFSPRVVAVEGSITARVRSMSLQSVSFNKKLEIDPYLIGTRIFTYVNSYLDAIEEAKLCFEKIATHSTCAPLLTKENVESNTVLTTFEKQIKVFTDKLKDQRLVPVKHNSFYVKLN